MDKKIKKSKDFINLGVVIDSKNQVLMIRRAKPEKGKEGAVLKWAFPGGGQYVGETHEECVEREVLSETGYDVEACQEIDLSSHPQFPAMIVYHFCELKSPKPVAEPKESEEIAEIRWVKTQQVRELITSALNSKVAEKLGVSEEEGPVKYW